MVLGGLVALALAGCTPSTRLGATWRDPNAAPLHKKTVVAFVAKDELTRRTVEDKMAMEIPNSTQSYKVVTGAAGADSAKIREHLTKLGFEGAVIMRVTDVQKELTYVPGSYWYGSPYAFGPYWGSAWGYPYDPGYVQVDQIVYVETNVYSLKNDKLLWAGRTQTTNPKSATKMADKVIARVVKALHDDGIIASCGDQPCTATNSDK